MSPMLWLIQLIFNLMLMMILIFLMYYSFYKKSLNINNKTPNDNLNNTKKMIFLLLNIYS